MLGKVLEGLLVVALCVPWSERWDGVSPGGAVRFQELVGFWITDVECMGSNVEKSKATCELGDEPHPLGPKVGVVPHQRFVETCRGSGVEKKRLCIGNNKVEASASETSEMSMRLSERV